MGEFMKDGFLTTKKLKKVIKSIRVEIFTLGNLREIKNMEMEYIFGMKLQWKLLKVVVILNTIREIGGEECHLGMVFIIKYQVIFIKENLKMGWNMEME